MGQWAIPGGKVMAGETLLEACEREILEETGVRVRATGEPVYTFELIDRDDGGGIRFHYVIIDYVADFVGGEISPGDDAADAAEVVLAESVIRIAGARSGLCISRSIG